MFYALRLQASTRISAHIGTGLLLASLLCVPVGAQQTPPEVSAPPPSGLLPLPLPVPDASPKKAAPPSPAAISATPSAATTANPTVAKPSAPKESEINKEALDRIRNNSQTQLLYTWKDKNGKINVTNTPPPDIIRDTSGILDPKLITITGEKSTTGKSYQDQLKDLDAERNKSKEQESKDLDKKQTEATKKLNCDLLKGKIALYSGSRPVATAGPDGKNVVLSNDQKQSTLNNFKSGYETLCGQ